MVYNKNLNLTAYDGVEEINNFEDQEQLEEYRRTRLESTTTVIDYISRFVGKSNLRVLELGSGSSCLLYALESNGIILSGVGIELSSSRHQFAQLWAAEHGYKKVSNIKANISDYAPECGKFDLVLIIDNTFAYLYPMDSNLPEAVLRKAHDALGKNGYLLLDMTVWRTHYLFSCDTNEYTRWVEYSNSARFKYGLYRNIFFRNEGIVQTESRYIKKNGEEQRKVELSKVYSFRDLEFLLSKYGFRIVQFHNDFSQKKFDKKCSDNITLVAQRVS